MELKQLKGVLEGLLFVSGDEGLSKKQIKDILSVDYDTVNILIDELKYDYEHSQRGLSILEQKEIFYLTTKPEHALFYEKMKETTISSRLSQAALETLAIVAYQQPITEWKLMKLEG